MRCFGDVFEKTIDVDVFDDVLWKTKHRANDASNDVNCPPLHGLSAKCTKEEVKSGSEVWQIDKKDNSMLWDAHDMYLTPSHLSAYDIDIDIDAGRILYVFDIYQLMILTQHRRALRFAGKGQ